MRLCESHNTGMKDFSSNFFDVLSSYNWPGNVRELHSTLEWVMAQTINEPTLFQKHLPSRIRIQVARSSFGDQAQNGASPETEDN